MLVAAKASYRLLKCALKYVVNSSLLTKLTKTFRCGILHTQLEATREPDTKPLLTR